jgi:hypothetical protein
MLIKGYKVNQRAPVKQIRGIIRPFQYIPNPRLH